jgi:hypothetical protein
MPDWDEINKRLKERSRSRGKDTPYEESWTEQNTRLENEDIKKDEARKNNPGLYKIQKKIVTDDIFGIMWLGRKIKQLRRKK